MEPVFRLLMGKRTAGGSESRAYGNQGAISKLAVRLRLQQRRHWDVYSHASSWTRTVLQKKPF